MPRLDSTGPRAPRKWTRFVRRRSGDPFSDVQHDSTRFFAITILLEKYSKGDIKSKGNRPPAGRSITRCANPAGSSITLTYYYITLTSNSKVLIIEDVITTGKSTLECVRLVKKYKAKVIGFACIIDRTNNKNTKIKKKITSHIKIDIPTYNKKNLPKKLKLIPITVPGSRYVR